jgi:hypothetical protein
MVHVQQNVKKKPSVHVSSVTVLIVRRANCINTSYGMISLYE